MKPATHVTGVRSAFSRVREWVGRPLGRGVLVLCGLGVLSLVGRFAVAGGHVSPVASSSSALLPPSIIVSAQPPAPIAVVVDAAAPTPIHHGASATEDDPVILNDASIDDLRRLPGVGEKRAMAILDLRRKLGHFKQVEELLHVKGIGRATLRKLRPLVRIDHLAGDGGVP
jgi:competence ComEA-like helix-hairpin-helix protein